MRNPMSADVLVGLLKAARYEVLPTATVEDKVLEHLPLDRALTVTASPTKGLDATVELSERLAKHGYSVVPHLAARMVRDRSQLSEVCDRLTSAGIKSVFIPAGDKTPPEGSYDAALPLLEELTALGRPFADVGITGYPETHPLINDDIAIQSMWDKRRHATHIVSNLTFSPAAIDSWVKRLRTRGVTMPVFLGVPGPVQRAKLLAMATKIGVGESTRFLAKNKGLFGRLAAPGGFSGERFVQACATRLGGTQAGVTGLHVYSFNQIAETEAWLSDLQHRLSAR
jgi:methylenetetrahydrofolate reductase (NADH)